MKQHMYPHHASPPGFGAAVQLICLVAAVGLVVNLFILGSQPFAAGLIPQPWDKFAHFAVYSAITALLLFSTAMRWPLTVLITVAAIGVCDELHQASLPGRVADAADFMVDFAAGAITGGLLLLYAHPGSGRKAVPIIQTQDKK